MRVMLLGPNRGDSDFETAENGSHWQVDAYDQLTVFGVAINK